MGLFYFDDVDKPTPFSAAHALRRLGWQQNESNHLFSNDNFDIPLVVSNAFEEKHRLAQILTKHCPDIIPETHIIDSSNVVHMTEILTGQPGPWILKPALLNNGEGIRLFKDISSIRNHFEQGGYFLGPHVLQQYIYKPHLLGGHKYSFRLFAVYSSTRGVFLYKQGYFNICRHPYEEANFESLHSHLTNEHLSADNQANSHQIPTSRVDNFTPIYQAMLSQVIKLFDAYNKEGWLHFQGPQHKMAVYGIDFMLDQSLQPYVLETNHGACFPTATTHPLFTSFYEPFWYAVATNFIHAEFVTSVCEMTRQRDFDAVFQL